MAATVVGKCICDSPLLHIGASFPSCCMGGGSARWGGAGGGWGVVLGGVCVTLSTNTVAAAGTGFWLIHWCVQLGPLKGPFAGTCRLHRNDALTLVQRTNIWTKHY